MMMRGVVIVADDEELARDAIVRALEPHGFLLLTARDGREALARMHGYSSRAVLLVDLTMPGMSGLELIAAVESDGALRRIGIVIVSGAREVPASSHEVVKKPFTPARLLAAVERAYAATADR